MITDNVLWRVMVKYGQVAIYQKSQTQACSTTNQRLRLHNKLFPYKIVSRVTQHAKLKKHIQFVVLLRYTPTEPMQKSRFKYSILNLNVLGQALALFGMHVTPLFKRNAAEYV